MSKKESKWDFCGLKIGLNDSFWGDGEGHIFCDSPCLTRFQMGDKDKCTNCNKKIFRCALTAKDYANDNLLYLC